MATTIKTRTTRAELTAAEDVIATAQRWAGGEARALLTIRDRRLYLDLYTSFGAYVSERWGMEEAHAHRLCSFAQTVAVVSPIGEPPARESHARPLAGLSPDQQREAWRGVLARKERVTAEVVSEVVREQLRRKTQQKPTEVAQRPTGEIIVADARYGLSKLANGSVDLLLFSPPYAMQRARDYPSVPEDEYPAWMCSILDAAKPKLTAIGSVMVVIREHVKNGNISDYVLKTRLAVREHGWNEIDVLMWAKPDAPPTGRPDRPRRAYESVYWWSPTSTPFCDPIAIGTPSKEPRDRMARSRTIKSGHHGHQPFARFRADQPSRVTDVIQASIGTSSAGIDHPAPYPLTLADQLVRTYSPPSGLVADCCCGSGTTLVAARDAGRRWWGCDIKREYVTNARKRLQG